ncbi:MAG: ParB/RepB/Spo0J family partition protein [Candidatus Competibacteraceae bacterium]|nr:ParB/RepB/Spo0J family partition protein [Candidatus Competibacteraceae bacterium]
MSRRKPLKSLSDWIGAGGHSFNGSLLKSDDDGAIRQLELDRIIAGRYQPRHRTDDDYLAELERSVRQFGIIEPLVVRPLADGSYEILAGHMRWRAAQQAGLSSVPAVLREADDRTAAAIALVENLLRRALNPIEEGRALRRLREEFDLTQEQLAELLGLSQPAISKALRLLSLDPKVQELIEDGKLEAGHGKTLLGLSRAAQVRLAEQTAAASWSVRELERRRTLLAASPPSRSTVARDPDLVRLEERLRERLAAPVRLRYDAARGYGRIEISFSSLEECDGILSTIGINKADK